MVQVAGCIPLHLRDRGLICRRGWLHPLGTLPSRRSSARPARLPWHHCAPRAFRYARSFGRLKLRRRHAQCLPCARHHPPCRAARTNPRGTALSVCMARREADQLGRHRRQACEAGACYGPRVGSLCAVSREGGGQRHRRTRPPATTVGGDEEASPSRGSARSNGSTRAPRHSSDAGRQRPRHTQGWHCCRDPDAAARVAHQGRPGFRAGAFAQLWGSSACWGVGCGAREHRGAAATTARVRTCSLFRSLGAGSAACRHSVHARCA